MADTFQQLIDYAKDLGVDPPDEAVDMAMRCHLEECDCQSTARKIVDRAAREAGIEV